MRNDKDNAAVRPDRVPDSSPVGPSPRLSTSSQRAPVAAEYTARFFELRWLSTMAGTRRLTTPDRSSFSRRTIFCRASSAYRLTLLLDSCRRALKASKTWGSGENRGTGHQMNRKGIRV